MENLKNQIESGKLAPKGTLDLAAYVEHNDLKIVVDSDTSSKIGSEIVVFFWVSDQKKAIYIRKVELEDGCIVIPIEESIMLQMKYLQFHYARVAIIYKEQDNYVCNIISNKTVGKNDYEEAKRTIGMLNAYKEDAFIAYWTDKGLLSVRFRKKAEVEKEILCAQLVEFSFNKNLLIMDIEMPIMQADFSVVPISMTSGHVWKGGVTKLEKKNTSGLKWLYTCTVDLQNLTEEINDAYRFVISAGDLELQLCVSGENLIQKSETIELLGGKTKDVILCHEENENLSLQINDKIYNHMLSIVTAVYNTKLFLAEMIYSVLKQEKLEDLNKYIVGHETDDYSRRCFIDCFEFILVDDGSMDGSAEVLDDFSLIDSRIKVIHKENGGVSSARNEGMKLATGKFINFVDSDDILEETYFLKCLKFFMDNEESISAVTTPMVFFDAQKGGHWTNYKFKEGTKIVDLQEVQNAVFYGGSASLFKKDIIEQYEIRFDETVKNGEDWLFIVQYFLKSNLTKIGLISDALYMYRKRSEGEESAVTSLDNTPFNYVIHLERVFERVMREAKTIYGYVPGYVQEYVVGQLQWKILTADKGVKAKRIIGEDEYKIYKEKIFEILREVDPSVIINQKQIWNEHKYFMLKKKYGKPADRIRVNDDVKFVFDDSVELGSFSRLPVYINFINENQDDLIIEGTLMTYEDDIDLCILVNDEQYEYEMLPTNRNIYSLDEEMYYAKDFKLRLKLNDKEEKYELKFKVSSGKMAAFSKNIRMKKFSRISGSYNNAYTYVKNWCVKAKTTCITVQNIISNSSIVDYEKLFVDEVVSKTPKEKLRNLIALRKKAREYLASKQNVSVWLISDQPHRAGDNGEALFKYICTHPNMHVKPYFVINSDSEDYLRLQQYGNVIKRGSEQHLFIHLIADWIISSAADDTVCNPWVTDSTATEVVKDLLNRPKYVFLQHGITKDDISGWIERYKKNFTGIVCAASDEAKSFMDYDYYYSEENIWLTGFPRHDSLYNDEKRYITIMPTWRKALTSGIFNSIKKGFENSSYYKFYNELINSERLLSAADMYNYKIAFMPHPTIRRDVYNTFKKDQRVIFFDEETSYTKMYAESSMVVTDYSSAAIDFALLDKPIVYCQFDKEEFFNSHSYKPGYFDYERDGFGEVTYDMDELIDVLIDYMKNECKVHEPYKDRMDRFFAYHDSNSCQRVVDKILSLG